MSGDLLRVLVCSPAAAGWNEPAHADRWRELGFHHRPDFDKARESHQALVRALVQVGATPCFLPDSATQSLDAVYCHDASIITDEGAICLRMAKPQRQAEPSCHQAWYKSAGIPTVGTIEEPGTVEAGDIIW
ncbi:MAG TPA: hypothetical protein VE398_04910 [Acidobacteriota bacterium]|nr:hypothetical protein [Acidobacteriota bacterium]